jgi:steroid delta-isomerase-like uncharacterized protein
MNLETNKKLVRRYFEEAINQRNTAVLADLLSPDFKSYLPTGSSVDAEQYGKILGISLAAFPDLHVTILDQIAEGDKVVTRWQAAGTQTGPFAGLPATGRVVTVTAMHIHRLENGRFVEHWEEFDMFRLVQQVGAIPQMQ